MDQFQNPENHKDGANKEENLDNSLEGVLPPIVGALIAYDHPGEDRVIVGAAPIKVVPHEDHLDLVTGSPIGPVQARALNLKSAEDVFRAFEGDSGASTSVGYSPKYGSNWDKVFGTN